MTIRRVALVGTATAALVVSLATVPAGAANPEAEGAQTGAATAATYTVPRTPDGHPDMQGVWTFKTVTPLERPAALANKEFLTPEEAKKFEEDTVRSQNRDLFDPKKGNLNYAPESEGGVIPYNEFWYDRGDSVVPSRRTSLVIDPPNGRLPALTPEAQKAAEARRERGRLEQRGRPTADNPEDRSVGDRCIMGFNAGPPMLPGGYNQNLRIVQSRDNFVVFTEMVHNARVIPFDGRTHLPMRQWSGSSRGRWEGDTFVVETKNFYFRTSMQGSSPNTHLIEKFTRIDADTINYEITVTDPTTWTRPWTAIVALRRMQEELYEYACHEGNTSLANVLAGARAQDRADARQSAR